MTVPAAGCGSGDNGAQEPEQQSERSGLVEQLEGRVRAEGEIAAAGESATGEGAERPGRAGAASLSDAVEAVMEWLEVVASSASAAEVEAGLRAIATPYGVEATAAAAMGDADYVTHRTLVHDAAYAGVLDSSLVAVRALSVRAVPIGESRVQATVWYTLVTVVPQPGGGAGEASYYLSSFEFAFDETEGWRLDSAAAGDEMRVPGAAPSVIRSADSAVLAARETLAALNGHVAVRELDEVRAGGR